MRVIVANKAEEIPKKPVDGKPTLVYWNILGLSQSQRLAMVAAGVDDFVDVRIEAGDFAGPNYGKNWLAAKQELDESKVLTFPNLPYFLDDKVQLTQSGTIMHYIARQYANHDKTAPLVYVSNATLQSYQDMILDTLSDLEAQIASMSYTQGPDAVKEWYLSGSIAAVLKKFESLDNVFWKKAAGESQVTIAHLKLYVYLYKLSVIQKEFGNDKTALFINNDWCKAFMTRIEGLPKIKEYMASSDYMKGPINNGSAKWRGM